MMLRHFITTIIVFMLVSSCKLQDGEKVGVVYLDGMGFDIEFYRGIMREEIYVETEGGLPDFSHVAEGFSTKITVELRASSARKKVGHALALQAAHKYCSKRFWKTLPDYRSSDPKSYGIESQNAVWVFVGVCV